MALVSVHFTLDVIRFAGALLEADGTGRWQVAQFRFSDPGIFRRIGARYRDWYRSTFHPWVHDNRAKLAEWRQTVKLPADWKRENLGIAALVQDAKAGEVLQAASMPGCI